jgi:protein-S-isoprenylcysteine O-methyltransferase Ste14
MWILYVSLLMAAVLFISVFTIARSRERIRKRYSSKSRAEITEARVFAKKYFILFLCITFIVPIPLAFLSAFFAEGLPLTVFAIVIALLILLSLVQAYYWWNVEGITRSLLEDLRGGSLEDI